MSYTPKNNFNFQLKRTGVGEKVFKKKLLADVACCDALDYDFRFDFNPDYVSAGGGIVINIIGGCGDFTWELAGSICSSFTLDEVVTSVRYNIVRAAIDDDFGDFDTLTVTDSCGIAIETRIICCSGLNCCGLSGYTFTYSGDDPIELNLDINSCEYYNYWLRLTGGCSPILWESDHVDIKFMDTYSNIPRNQLTVVGDGAYEGILTVTDECGTAVEIGYTVCCNNPDYVFFVSGNLSGLEPGETVTFTITGGCSPYQWFSLLPNFTWAESETVGLTNDLTFAGGSMDCDDGDLYVKDSCCEIALITCDYIAECVDVSELFWDYEISAETIVQERDVVVAVTGGKGPYRWSVSGTGFTLDHAETDGLRNILRADNTACGTAIITVIDYCEQDVIGCVRCTTGFWIFHEDVLVQACSHGNCLNPPPTPPDCAVYCGSGTFTEGMWRVIFDALSSNCTYGDNPATSYRGSTITVAQLTGCSAPFLSFPNNSVYGRTAHFYRWGCE